MPNTLKRHQVTALPESRAALAERLAGKHPTVLEPGYLDALRQEWERFADDGYKVD